MPFYYLCRFVVSKTVLVLLCPFCIGKAGSVEVYKSHKEVRKSFRIIYFKLNDEKCEA